MDISQDKNKQPFSLSVVVPALNEEENISSAVLLIKDALESSARINAFEIIIVNDGSADKTGEIALHLSKEYDNILYLENENNRGIGYCYRKAFSHARYDYFTWLAADGSYIKEELLKYFEAFRLDRIPVSYSYTEKAIKSRTFLRRMISLAHRRLIWLLFGIRGINYINGMALYERKFLQGITIRANGFSLMAELVLRAWKKGYLFQNVAMDSVERTKGKSKIFKFYNIMDSLRTISILLYEFYIRGLK